MDISEKEDSIQLITFRVGQELFGIDIFSIREIVRDPEIEPLDKGPAFVDGVMQIRGETIPVIDLKRRMKDSQKISPDTHPWVMINHNDSYIAGFLVDEVSRILKIQSDSIMTAPDLVLEGLRRPYIRGVCESGAGMLVVLDFNELFSADEMAELKQTGAR